MIRTLRVLLFTVILGMTSCQTTQPPQPSPTYCMIYVHGFGGRRLDPWFLREMRKFQKKTDTHFELINHHWDSGKLRVGNVKQAGPLWRQANLDTEKEAKLLLTRIRTLEKQRKPYYLGGHSLGTKIICLALNAHGKPVKQCRGIYFMGAALPKNFTLNAGILPKGFTIINYHSPDYDFVLDYSFRTAEGQIAGGQVGFDDESTFTNYSCACTHARKPGVHSDWSTMATAIGYQILWKEDVEIPGKVNWNWKTKVGEGNHFWNTIMEFDAVDVGSSTCKVIIQQHKVSHSFRAISVTNGKRRRLAWDGNLHAILKKLGLWDRRH